MKSASLTVLAVLVLASSFVAGCATTAVSITSDPVAPLTGKPIFPAIYRAFQALGPGPTFGAVDITQDRFEIRDIEFKDGLIRRKLDLHVALDQGTLDFDVSHEAEFDERRSSWITSSMYVFRGAHQIRHEFEEQVREAFGEPGPYAVGREAALEDLVFVHRCLESLDDPARQAWVSQTLGTQPLELAVSVRSARAATSTFGATQFAHEVECLPAPEAGTNGALDGDRVLFETNADPSGYPAGSLIHIRGTIVAAQRLGAKGFSLQLVDAH